MKLGRGGDQRDTSGKVREERESGYYYEQPVPAAGQSIRFGAT
jgi:hypothetical protein